MKKEIKVKFGAETKGLNKGFDDAQKKVGNFSSSVKKAAIGLGAAFGAAAVLNGIKSMVSELTNAADRLLDLEQITGLSTDRLQEYEHVARVAGVNSETLANAVQGLTRRMAGATTESSPLNLALKELGIVSRDTSGHLRNGGVIMEEAIAKLAAMENITERNVLGAQMFGGAWKDIAPILALGADGMEKAQKEARRLGLVMDKESLVAANDLRIEIETLNAQWTIMKREITMAIVPALNELITAANQTKVAFRALNESESLSWWQKLTAKAQVFFGIAIRDTSTLAAGMITVGNATEELNEKIDAKNQTELGGGGEIIQQLGVIESLKQRIAEEEEAAIKALTKADYDRHAKKIAQLKRELEMFQTLTRAQEEPIKQMETLPAAKDQYSDQMEKRTSAASEHFDAVAQMSKYQGKLDDAQIDSMEQIGIGLANLAASGQASAKDMIKALLAEATAALIKHIMITVPFPANIALAMGAGAAVGGLQSQIPAFADGGMVKSPTLAMFGEYPGARTNPEYALRHDQLEKIASGGNVRVVGKITGENIYLSNERFGRRTQLVE